MSSAYSLRLTDGWDLSVDGSGGIAVCKGDYATAQNVANAVRLFTNDAWYFPERGIPHFAIELKKRPALSVLKSRVREAALGVDGVADCAVSVLNLEDRNLTGIALLTLEDGTTANVEI